MPSRLNDDYHYDLFLMARAYDDKKVGVMNPRLENEPLYKMSFEKASPPITTHNFLTPKLNNAKLFNPLDF